MKNINKYSTSYQESNNHLDYLKYGLLNEYGPSLNSYDKQSFNEEDIVKKKCKGIISKTSK